MENSGKKKSTENPISVGDVSGNVVIAQNQIGGITAHTVNVNREKQLSNRDKQAILDFIETVKIRDNFDPTSFEIAMVNNSNGNKIASQIEALLKEHGYTMNGVGYGIMMRYPDVKGILFGKASNKDCLLILVGQV